MDATIQAILEKRENEKAQSTSQISPAEPRRVTIAAKLSMEEPSPTDSPKGPQPISELPPLPELMATPNRVNNSKDIKPLATPDQTKASRQPPTTPDEGRNLPEDDPVFPPRSPSSRLQLSAPELVPSPRRRNRSGSRRSSSRNSSSNNRLSTSFNGEPPQNNTQKEEPSKIPLSPDSQVGLDIPRLVKRDLPFNQSSNKVSIGHNQGKKILPLLRHDWFHVFLRLPSKYSLFLLLSLWTIVILIFAGLYMAFDNLNDNPVCSLGLSQDEPIQFGAAFAMSLETCTTVGYGLPSGSNAYFESCIALQFLAYWQMVWSMLFNAFLFAFLYTRVARTELRGSQVVHSKSAIVSLVDGQLRWQCRVYDIDARHPVVEAHVRLYVIMKERPVPRPLRLLQPDDEMGAFLFMSFPTVVSHHVDAYSLLHPPTRESPLHPSGLVLRQVDSATASREELTCPACSENYSTYERLVQHIRYNKIMEAHDQAPVHGTHRSVHIPDKPKPPSMEQLRSYFDEKVSEIICVVEGIDPMMSGTFQSLHSYKLQDIIWDEHASYLPCIQTNDEHSIRVDLDRFHEVEYTKSAILPEDPGRNRRKKQVSGRPHDSLFAPSHKFFAPHDSFQTH